MNIPAHPTLGEPERTYTYHDAAGQPLFYVCRFKTADGKTFRQGRPTDNGSWAWSLNGITPVLYQLPELHAHLARGSSAPIWIVEGEKDADALRAVGETATCNPMGAGKWRPEFTDTLTGARLVYIVADLDDPGQAHARQVYEAVSPNVDEALVLQPPETLGKGADISDMLDAGFELDALTTVRAADYIEGDPATIGRLKTQTLEEFSTIDEPSAKPILGDESTCLLSHGGMLILYGDGGAGKTTMEIDMVCHLASGTPWMGLHVHDQPRILIIENEGPRGMFRKKTRNKLAAWQGAPIDGRIHVLEDPWAVFSFAEDGYRDQLRQTIQELDIDIVAAGPVNRLGVEGGGTPEEVGAFILHIELIRQTLERPLAVIFAHHENKAGDVSGAWEGVPDTLAHVRNDGNGHTTVHWQKVRWGPDLHGKTWKLLWRDGETFELDEKVERTDDEIAEAMIAYISDHPGTTWKGAKDAVGTGAERAATIRDELLEAQRIVNVGTPSKMCLYPSGTTPTPDDPDGDIPL